MLTDQYIISSGAPMAPLWPVRISETVKQHLCPSEEGLGPIITTVLIFLN